jgi:hypothetical protein
MDGICLTFDKVATLCTSRPNPAKIAVAGHSLARRVREYSQSYRATLLADASRPLSKWNLIAATGYGIA